MTNTIEEDFLEVDNEISGQKFTCLSFISPENVLRNKDLFMVHHFLKATATEYNLSESDVVEKYKTFLFSNEKKLEEVFHKENDFQTTVRGVKIRGTYSSLREAQARAKRLQKLDPNFNVYVGQVGFWLPWDPTPDNIEDQEYANTELNELVKKYNENQRDKEEHFRENIDYVREQESLKLEKKEELIKKKQAELKKEIEEKESQGDVSGASIEEITDKGFEIVNNLMAIDDPWISRKKPNAVSDTVNSVLHTDALESALEESIDVAKSASVAATEAAVESAVETSAPLR